MNRASSISIVVPVLDESVTLAQLVDRLANAMRDEARPIEVVVVDDGSAPEEGARIQTVHHRRLTVRHLTHVRRFGQSSAIFSGVVAATGELVLTMDGDLQDPPEDLPKLVAALDQGAQVAKGTRRSLEMAWWRQIGSRLTTRVARHLLERPLPDYGGQFNGYRRESLPALLDAWRPGRPLIPLACHLGLEVVPIPVDRHPRRYGRSRYKVPDLARLLIDLVLDFGGATELMGAVTVAGVITAGGRAGAARVARPSTARALRLLPTALVAAGAWLIADRVRNRRREEHPVALEVARWPASARSAEVGPR